MRSWGRAVLVRARPRDPLHHRLDAGGSVVPPPGRPRRLPGAPPCRRCLKAGFLFVPLRGQPHRPPGAPRGTGGPTAAAFAAPLHAPRVGKSQVLGLLNVSLQDLLVQLCGQRPQAGLGVRINALDGHADAHDARPGGVLHLLQGGGLSPPRERCQGRLAGPRSAATGQVAAGRRLGSDVLAPRQAPAHLVLLGPALLGKLLLQGPSEALGAQPLVLLEQPADLRGQARDHDRR
mmetsp:Transcript_72963/g.217765  ORF Transcript_72963/g.217765 Transcript_72963/m.217765 type:complete len:234 (+) Transcript_72963:882-1583(+)